MRDHMMSAAPATKPGRLIQHFHSDEDGSAMTEFVISLPAFLVIFVAIFQFTMVQAAATEVHVRAAKRVWTAALPVQKTKMMQDHMVPALSATKSGPIVNARGGFLSKATDGAAKVIGLPLTGHFGESYAMVIKYETLGVARFGLPTGNRVKKSVREVVNTGVAQRMASDGLSKPSASSGLGALSSVIGSVGGRMALGAGIRYGLVEGKDEKTVTLPGGVSWTTNAMYDVMVSPYPHSSGTDHAQTVGIVRLTIEECQLYSTILGIESSNRYKNRCPTI